MSCKWHWILKIVKDELIAIVWHPIKRGKDYSGFDGLLRSRMWVNSLGAAIGNSSKSGEAERTVVRALFIQLSSFSVLAK